MINPTIPLTMNKSNQVTFPVAIREFLHLGETATLSAKMRSDGVLEITREQDLDEIRQQAFATMTPHERRRVDARAEEIQRLHPDPQDLTDAETDWLSLPWYKSNAKKEMQRYGI